MMKLEEKVSYILKQKEEIIFAYLFGSKAEGRDNELSDVDIAVYIDREKMPESGLFGYRSEMIVQMQQVLQEKVDFIILNDAPFILAHQVLDKGRLLFARSEAERRKFHEETMRKYLDFLPFLRVQEKYQQERLKEGMFGRE